MATNIGGSFETPDDPPGICSECYCGQRSARPSFYYCKHRHRLSVQEAGTWTTHRDVTAEQVLELIPKSARDRFRRTQFHEESRLRIT